MTSCVFPGSFNPVTNGHMDLIRRASKLFDRVSVVVMVNLQKHEVIPTAESPTVPKPYNAANEPTPPNPAPIITTDFFIL